MHTPLTVCLYIFMHVSSVLNLWDKIVLLTSLANVHLLVVHVLYIQMVVFLFYKYWPHNTVKVLKIAAILYC